MKFLKAGSIAAAAALTVFAATAAVSQSGGQQGQGQGQGQGQMQMQDRDQMHGQMRGSGDRMHHADYRGHGRQMGGHGRGGGRIAGLLENFDTDGDGGVTQEEIDAFRQGQISEFDANGDGNLDLSEYEALWLDAMRERMVDRFQAHDDDGDGSVTPEEFNENFDGLVERMDRNDDGVLNADDMGAGRQ